MKNKDHWKLAEFGEAIAKLTADREAFKKVFEAYEKQDVEKFQAELKRLHIEKFRERICHWLCLKKCVIICRMMCRAPPPSKLRGVEEIRRFGEAVVKIIKEKGTLESLIEAYEKQDVEGFQEILKRLQLTRFCSQICYWICRIRCKRKCKDLCTAPSITHVGYIPTTQIDSEGYAMGPSQPPGTTPPPTSYCGHHPFGGLANVRGTFNLSNPNKYKVEWASNVGGPWNPIMSSITEEDASVWPHVNKTRYPSGPPDPGWYNVADMIDSHYLTDLDTTIATPSTGKFYLRLTVKNLMGASFQSPIVPVRVDNDRPTVPKPPQSPPHMDLFIKKPDGTEEPVKCGGIKKGDGTLLIKFIAWDENFRQLTLTAQGGCGLNIPIIDETTGTTVSRGYGGDITDKGEPVLRVVEWDPWKDNNIVPCCYNVVLRIWDRAIVDNFYSGGRHNSDWEAVEIALG